MPDCENPTADSSTSSSAAGLAAIVVLVVENESRIDTMSWAAFEYACGGLAEQLPVLLDRRHPRVHREQYVVRIGDRLTDDVTLAAHCFGHR